MTIIALDDWRQLTRSSAMMALFIISSDVQPARTMMQFQVAR
jgi:hypothetical protein